MNLFAKERPEASPGQKALLLDGSAVPNLTIVLNEDNRCDIVVNLRNYNYSERSYSQYRYNTTSDDLDNFIQYYISDPEDAIECYFGWKPQAIGRKPASPAAGRIHQITEDLL